MSSADLPQMKIQAKLIERETDRLSTWKCSAKLIDCQHGNIRLSSASEYSGADTRPHSRIGSSWSRDADLKYCKSSRSRPSTALVQRGFSDLRLQTGERISVRPMSAGGACTSSLLLHEFEGDLAHKHGDLSGCRHRNRPTTTTGRLSAGRQEDGCQRESSQRLRPRSSIAVACVKERSTSRDMFDVSGSYAKTWQKLDPDFEGEDAPLSQRSPWFA